MFFETPDGSVLDDSGRILYFSVERFIEDICLGHCCFICGSQPSTVQFNDEHVLPRWVLKKFGLFEMSINLPNLTTFRYDRYTIPCCEPCNGLMGRKIETPISELIDKGHSAVCQYLRNHGPELFFIWLNLIFIKTHLKDKSLRLHRDRRQPGDTISDHYSWEELHHIHCIARSFYTGAELEPAAFGSVFVLSAKMTKGLENFDYGDLYHAKTMLLRLDETAFLTVLNDSCAVWNIMSDFFKQLTGPLSPLQLRELMARAASVYLHLEQLPRFSSSFKNQSKRYAIVGSHPDAVKMNEEDPTVYGALLESTCGELIEMLESEHRDRIKDAMRRGQWTFLFDELGQFERRSMDREDSKRTDPE